MSATMSDKGDKGNPLDRLTRPGGRPLSDDESIPVLTERLSLPSLDLDVSLPKPPPPSAAAAAASSVTAEPAAASARTAAARTAATVPTYSSAPATRLPEIDWPRIESALRDAVLRELQPALADEVARVLRERLQPAVDRALVALTSEVRQALEVRLRETLARAVAAEIERLRDRG
jgi:hypothetical protein